MRLTDADMIVKAIGQRAGCDAHDEWAKGFDAACSEIIEMLRNAPEIETGTVIHAQRVPPPGNSKALDKCSRCGAEVLGLHGHFCDNCGAKFDEG